MKIRHGFVTNSSSSSFLLLAISNYELIEEVAQKLGFSHEHEDISHGVWWSDKDIALVGIYGDLYYAGIDPEELLEKMTLPELREYASKQFKELGLDIPPELFHLRYGEVYDN